MPTDTPSRGGRPHGHGHNQNLKVKDAAPPAANGKRASRRPAASPSIKQREDSSVKDISNKEVPPNYAASKEITSSIEETKDPAEVAVLHSGEENVYMASEQSYVNNTENNDVKIDVPPPGEHKHSPKREYKKCTITPENFNVREFNSNMTQFIQTFEDPRYSQIDQDYPVDELVSVVDLVTKSVNSYRAHSADSQRQLEALTDALATIKENLHFSVTRQAMDLRLDHEYQSEEELELRAKLTQLNASLAKANADVTESIRLATETEGTAVKANIAAERARESARRIQEETKKKEEADIRRREEEGRRMEEQKRQKEADERKALEEQRKKEEEWRRREQLSRDVSSFVYDSWPAIEYEHTQPNGDVEVTCIARGQPGSFSKSHVTCHVSKDKEALLSYLPHEELISKVVDITSASGDQDLKHPIYVAIPHVLSRTSAHSREAVVKAMVGGEWQDLPTRDVTFDSHKDTKFAQAEVRHLTTLIVMSRFKRDYVKLTPNKPHRVTSSFDHRVTLTFEKGTFSNNEHFLLQVQPVDNSTVQDFRGRQPLGKALLTSSHIVHASWENSAFLQPIEVTLPCPPNPAKAKKMALARKLKEEKLKTPINKHSEAVMTDVEREKENERRRMQQYIEENGEVKKLTKWYMGEYANSDDDETDRLHFLYYHAGKWFAEPDMEIKQVKVDVVAFTLEHPVEKFVVLRTRTSVDEEASLPLIIAFSEYLSKKFVEAVVRQKTNNPLQVALQVIPVSRLEAAVKDLAQSGFGNGPKPSHVICLNEGDVIELGFSGNIECKEEIPSCLVYKSNVPTVTYFTVREENKFRQKDQEMFSGLLSLTRRSLQAPGGRRGQEGQDDHREIKRERLCALQINIPKYHVEPNTEPKKAPVTIMASSGSLDTSLLMSVAEALGDEWRKVAHYLGVHRARVQAIMRNITVGERPDTDAKYEMLLTWMKGATKALDKATTLASALRHSDRYDVADMVEARRAELTGKHRHTLVDVN